MSTLHKYDDEKIIVFDTWFSIDMGAKIEFEPIGMWGQRVWQNKATFVCTGKINNTGTIHYTYRFTKIGDSSVSKEFYDIILTAKDIQRWYDEGQVDTHEIRTPFGYVMFGEDEV